MFWRFQYWDKMLWIFWVFCHIGYFGTGYFFLTPCKLISLRGANDVIRFYYITPFPLKEMLKKHQILRLFHITFNSELPPFGFNCYHFEWERNLDHAKRIGLRRKCHWKRQSGQVKFLTTKMFAKSTSNFLQENFKMWDLLQILNDQN